MDSQYTNWSQKTPVFLVKTSLIITALAVLLLTPFSLIHFAEDRNLLGFSSLAIVFLCGINAWNCLKNRYQPLLILLGIAPCIILSLVFVFRDLGVEGMLWSYPAALSFYFMLPSRYAGIANTVLFAIVVPEAWSTIDSYLATRFTVTLLMTSIFAGVFISFISQQQNKLETLATKDTLTGLLNRTLLESSLHRAIEQSHRLNTPMTLLMLDLDHFKVINDTYGHLSGDAVLQGIGAYFQKRVRGSDAAFRVGGEEFIILLNDADASTAHRVAENMRKEIALLPLLSEQAITVSVGIAQLQHDDDIDTWLTCADTNLYKAKSSGRNQVVVSSSETTSLNDI